MFFLDNSSIDRSGWDRCIQSTESGVIYASSFYLDCICPGWGALVGPEYEWVLPITSGRKFGINYLYQPAFTQQLGVFAKNGITIPYDEILSWLKKHYRFWEVNWNYTTPVNIITDDINITSATNYIIDISQPYNCIASNYSNQLKRNLHKSENYELDYQVSEDYNKCIQMYRQHYGNRIAHVTESDYTAFTSICKYALNNNMLVCRQVVNKHEEVLAIALLLRDEKRFYNLMPTTTSNGRKALANHYLFDRMLQEFSGTHLLFDFEGSDLPGVKRFYKIFGGVNQPYYQLKYNNLPWLLKLIKK